MSIRKWHRRLKGRYGLQLRHLYEQIVSTSVASPLSLPVLRFIKNVINAKWRGRKEWRRSKLALVFRCLSDSVCPVRLPMLFHVVARIVYKHQVESKCFGQPKRTKKGNPKGSSHHESLNSSTWYLVPVTSSYKEQVNLRGNNVQCTMKFTSHLVVNPSKWSRYQTRKWKLVLYKVVEPVVTTNKAIQYSTWQVGFT